MTTTPLLLFASLLGTTLPGSVPASAGPTAAQHADVVAVVADVKRGGTIISLNIGSGQGVEKGDQGRLLEFGTGGELISRFTIETVSANSSKAWVPLMDSEAVGKAEVDPSPGTTPKALTVAELGAGPMGSCAKNYNMYKGGKITAVLPPNGKIMKVSVDVGWKQRLCKDATGLIYVGTTRTTFLTDASGTKIRLQVSAIGYRTTVFDVIEGNLDAALLGKNTSVVVRVKK